MSAHPKDKPSPERVTQYSFGYAPPLIIEAAVKHKLFDALDAGPRTAEQVSAATGTSVRGVRILMNALVGLGLLVKEGADRYALTSDSAAFLVSTKPGYLGGFYQHTSSQLIPKWLKLADIVRTGTPAAAVNQEGDGANFFKQFVEDLFPFNYMAAKALGEALGIAKAKQAVSVLDLAAGSGVWSIALAQQSPHVRVTAVDWPDVLDVTKKVAAKHGVAERFHFVAGDLRDADFGTGHQIATLGHILHSEGSARSQALLKKVAAALAPGGTIAIAEWLVNDDRTGPPPGLIFAVNMLVNTDQGDTFTFNEIRRWLDDAGFTNARLLEVPGPSPLVLAEKAKA
jgi:ubiquinone/menaquinone biosynthesis C-methylase UbiE